MVKDAVKRAAPANVPMPAGIRKAEKPVEAAKPEETPEANKE
jgi:hypothetical protein